MVRQCTRFFRGTRRLQLVAMMLVHTGRYCAIPGLSYVWSQLRIDRYIPVRSRFSSTEPVRITAHRRSGQANGVPSFKGEGEALDRSV
ncbi:uncharacterized protein GGS25DRAFT_79146 [Hypoxylon fragiforme]|uniref:uncharacterized protein n=1 Tax=Hypoxylon fragiforme TaxID=63214 RepID=UPI0020C724C3|nr:uncharacterized protein GGS25DRAFT_79146 [Hypoxylon fragiforme]KAI2603071.1 hypothetical protein GGS25DRAFT_79146 [Hypoxylon fragiforme]